MITVEQVENWLGSDASRKDIVELLTEVANGFYQPEQLKKDIENDLDI